ncbi:syndecan-4 [Pristis pectinata]|uniref:syndecan-4 n=1 Tax=Pristis pectinata TaxID=685728 RepID=UPI00223DF11F|nr:syndecan-4 [Pristis pectinata]
MFKIWAVVTVLVIFTWNVSSAKAQKDLAKDSDRSHLNELEGSGYPGPSLYPDQMEDHGSGWASGDDTDSDEDGDLDDNEDEEELDNYIVEDENMPVKENPIQSNEVLLNKNAPSHDNIDNRVAMASTNNNSSMFASTEMLAAMIAGGTIGLLFAILLILLLVYRMRKKDEGSYDLSKKPIYKKAPTTEFYA